MEAGRAGAHRLDRCVCPVDDGLVDEAEERALPVVVGRVAAGPVVDGGGGAENGVGGTERPGEANGQGHVAGTGLGQDGGLDQEGADHRRHGDPGHSSRAEVEGRAGASRPDGPAAFENEAVQRPNVGEIGAQQAIEGVRGPRFGDAFDHFPGHRGGERGVGGDFFERVVVQLPDKVAGHRGQRRRDLPDRAVRETPARGTEGGHERLGATGCRCRSAHPRVPGAGLYEGLGDG